MAFYQGNITKFFLQKSEWAADLGCFKNVLYLA